jgi:hypothetical protein
MKRNSNGTKNFVDDLAILFKVGSKIYGKRNINLMLGMI